MAKQKPVRINLSTKPQEIIATMCEELPAELYQFRKQYGGRNKYMKFEDQLLDKALTEEDSQMTEANEHISRVGNRWITYTMVDYYPQAKYANATHVSFVYYETYGSCGAFFPVYQPNRQSKKECMPKGVMIFTSHFFLRMSERTGKAYRSKELVQEFISTKSTQASQADEDGEVIVKFKGGYGFGVEKSHSPQVLEIRTYLTDGQLSPKQRHKVECLDAYAELLSDGSYIKEVAVGAAYHTYNTPEKAEERGMKRLKALKKLGLEKYAMLQSVLHLSFVRLLEGILDMELTIPQGTLIAQIEAECGINDLVEKYIDYDDSTATEEEDKQFTSDAIDFFCKCARKMKLKSVNRESITAHIDSLMK